MSLFGEYVKEREGQEIIESDDGFLTYKAYPEEYRIFDLYVVPSQRRFGIGSKMADEVASLALKNGCKILTGSVDSRANGASSSAKALFGYGFRILRTEGPMIYFVKELQ